MKKLIFTLTLCMGFALSNAQTELLPDGTFEDTLRTPWGYWSATVAALDGMRVDSVAYEGTHSVRIYDHTWGVMLWNDVPGFTDSAEYTYSFYYKGAEPMKATICVGRDLGYDLATDPEKIVPAGATVEKINTTENGRITWPLAATTTWTKFSYTFKVLNWLGKDPESGDPISSTCAIMFENTSYAKDDGPSSYVDNVSISKKALEGNNTMVKSVATTAVSVYPNPSTNYINVKGISTTADIAIFSTTGQVVSRIKASNGQNINVSNLSNGVYFISVVNANGGSQIGKFIRR